MKKVAVLAIVLGALSGAAYAESAVESEPRLELARNDAISSRWAEVKPSVSHQVVTRIEADTLSKGLERVSAKLDRQLEAKIKRDLINAM